MKMSYREALRWSIREALKNDSRVFLVGEDVGAYGGSYAVSKDFLKEFGQEKILDAPLSELGFTGIGIGAALGGLRPIIEIMTVNFSLLALDQIINSAAFLCHMSGGQFSVPVVIRMTTGGGRQLAAQHSNSWEGWLAHVPGVKILTPGTVIDAKFMLQYALEDPNPVLIFEHALLLNHVQEIDENFQGTSPFKAMVLKEGRSLTLATYGGMLPRSLEAVSILEQKGKSIELIDLRCLRPLDEESILTSVKKTHRLLIVDEGWRSGSFAAEISARVMEKIFYELDAPVQRLCRREVPIPYAAQLERAAIPQTDDIVSKIQEMLR